ncbi:MAG: response regulator, partial [Campylobacterota bacterium]|nr:response regulator [Campylobacterota bacterium]
IKSMYLNSESIMSVVSGNEIFIVNIVDRTTLSKIKEKSTISSLVGNHEKIIYVVKNKVILYSFLTKKREVVYAGEDIKDIFYKDKLLVLDRKKLLIIKNKKKFIKLDKIEADKFIAVDNKIFYTKDNEIYKSENHVLKRKTDNTVRILTVDDSETIRRVLKTTILNNFKRVEVYEAKDGHGAMKALKNYNIDVMLLDWNMPIMDGEEVVNIINELNIYPDLKIIMATTQDSTSDVRKMVNKGVCGYLIKPFTPSSIVTFTKKIIDVVLKGRDV